MKSNVNINVTNMKNHFLYNINENKEYNKKTTSEKYITKIKKYDFISINEISISDEIKKTSYYSNNYILVDEYDFIDIGELTQKSIKKIQIDTAKDKYLIFKYKRYKLISFYDFLFNSRINKRPFKSCFFYIIESFSYILKSLIQINNIGICYFNLSPENIVFNLDCGEKPQIQNLILSLQLSKISEEYMTDIIKNTNDYSYKPLEIHVLFYLIENEINTVSYSLIEEITSVFVKNLTILRFFSDEYKESYKFKCVGSLKKYINQSKSLVILDILDILKSNNTLDIYSLSALYIDIFGDLLQRFSLKPNFITKLILELSKNIHPEHSKRGNFKTLLENYEKLFNDQQDWSFVNN